MSVSIFRYDGTRCEEIQRLILDIQTREFGVEITLADQPDLLDIASFYQRENGNFWIAVEDDIVVGTIALLDIGDDSLALRKMFVAQGYRGKRVAQQLLHSALSWADSRGVKNVFLGTTDKYHAAHRFYEKSGFREILKAALPESFPAMRVDSKFYHYEFGQTATNN